LKLKNGLGKEDVKRKGHLEGKKRERDVWQDLILPRTRGLTRIKEKILFIDERMMNSIVALHIFYIKDREIPRGNPEVLCFPRGNQNF
jgi:hypothetical protein